MVYHVTRIPGVQHYNSASARCGVPTTSRPVPACHRAFDPSPILPSPSPLSSGAHRSAVCIWVHFVSLLFLFVSCAMMSEITCCLSFLIGLVSLSITPSGSVPVVTNGNISSFFINYINFLYIFQAWRAETNPKTPYHIYDIHLPFFFPPN